MICDFDAGFFEVFGAFSGIFGTNSQISGFFITFLLLSWRVLEGDARDE